MVQQGSDPSIPYAYAQQREDQQNSFKNPMGAYTTAAVRDAANRVSSEKGSMNEAEAIKRSNYANHNQAFAQQMGVVNATQPLQTGQNVTTPFNPMSLVGPAAQIGMGAMTKGASSACWVAESIYGINDYRTLVMRWWLNTEVIKTRFGRCVMRFYRIFGYGTAKLAWRFPIVRKFLKDRIFDKALPHAMKAMKENNHAS